METAHWHERWQTGRIGFHLQQVNPLLVEHFPALELTPKSRVFLPLCGKSQDIVWLLSQGYEVIGIELSPIAIQQFFTELDITPTISTQGELRCYQAENLTLFEGDFFALNKAQLSTIDAIYDRAALVALPQTMRANYTQHLQQLSNHAPQLLISLDYGAEDISGPPFSVSSAEIQHHYAEHYAIHLLSTLVTPSERAKNGEANEQVWVLKPHTGTEKG